MREHETLRYTEESFISSKVVVGACSPRDRDQLAPTKLGDGGSRTLPISTQLPTAFALTRGSERREEEGGSGHTNV